MLGEREQVDGRVEERRLELSLEVDLLRPGLVQLGQIGDVDQRGDVDGELDEDREEDVD